MTDQATPAKVRLTDGLGAEPAGEWPDDYLPILTRRALYAAYLGQRNWNETLEREVANCAKRIHNQRAEIERLAAEAENLRATLRIYINQAHRSCNELDFGA